MWPLCATLPLSEGFRSSGSAMAAAKIDNDRLTELARSGDTAAWATVIARHGRHVLLTLLARGVPVNRAEEIVQETWERLVAKSRAGQLDRLELPGLAITQAAHLALDDARRNRTRNATSLDDSNDAQDVPDPAPLVLDRLVAQERIHRALAELARCPPKARDVFALVHDNPDLAHAETARRAGLSVQRLRQTLCEVRARLRAAMED